MKTLSLVHLGDVHYPRAKNRLGMVDVKDPRFPDKLLKRVAPHPLGNVMNEVRSLLMRQDDIHGILISGDLTTGAKMDEYRACIEYLRSCFEGIPLWSEGGLHVVPGNHDVDRTRVPSPDPAALPSATSSGGDSLEKFAEIERAWMDAGLPILPIDRVRRSDISHDGCQLILFSINSCLGCGEYRRVPEPYRKTYARMVARSKKRGVPLDSDLLDQLDTPAFDDEHLSEITTALSNTEAFIPAVVLGHHGILPQAYPRVALYTEVINGGVARFRLASCQNPVIYCHGHIHENPVEIVMQPDGGGRPLVLISAPELDAGFNLITFYFTSAGLVLGCEVIRFERLTYGGVKRSDPIRIPLGNREAPYYAHDEVSIEIGNALGHDWSRYKPFIDRVQRRLPEASEAEIATRLQEMEWLGVVQIESRLHDRIHWQVRRRVG